MRESEEEFFFWVFFVGVHATRFAFVGGFFLAVLVCIFW